MPVYELADTYHTLSVFAPAPPGTRTDGVNRAGYIYGIGLVKAAGSATPKGRLVGSIPTNASRMHFIYL